MDLIKIDYSNNSVNARDVYAFVFEGKKKKTAFNHWISRVITRYGFKEEKDFQSFMIKSTGGRPKVDYAVTIEMAKELAMIAPTENGRKVRKYFIKCEQIAKETSVEREALKKIRKTFTGAIQESGENERTHGHAYSLYTKMVYKLADIKYSKQEGFRDTLTADQLKRVNIIEGLIKPLLELGKEYADIKDYISPLFIGKE
jgi:phage anti-repressor protein